MVEVKGDFFCQMSLGLLCPYTGWSSDWFCQQPLAWLVPDPPGWGVFSGRMETAFGWHGLLQCWRKGSKDCGLFAVWCCEQGRIQGSGLSSSLKQTNKITQDFRYWVEWLNVNFLPVQKWLWNWHMWVKEMSWEMATYDARLFTMKAVLHGLF